LKREFLENMKLLMQLALLALSAAYAVAAPPANIALCAAQEKCIDFTIKKAEGTSCTAADGCGIEVCMILDTTKDGCVKEGPISHLCAASTAEGCAAYDIDGVTPLTGKGTNSTNCALSGENATYGFDGKCEPTQTKVVMCQEAAPGQTVYWALKDGNTEDLSVFDYTSNSHFTYEVGSETCSSPKISCFGDTDLQCADPQSSMYLKTRVWSYEIPANDGSACDLCGSGSESTPEWLWLACGAGKGNCGDTKDVQAEATSGHEVRCCATEKLGDTWRNNGGGCSGIWHESDLLGLNDDDTTLQCFYTSTYEEAVAICDKNNAQVCSKQQIEDGCVKGSGCGHDGDMIWTSDAAPPKAPLPRAEDRDPDDWLWLSCGNPGSCGAIGEFEAQAKEKHEVRCCSPDPVSGWRKHKDCDVWSESNLYVNGVELCFHEETFEDAQNICYDNGGYLCTKEQVEAGCARGTGCGHDKDLIWTSTTTTAPAPIVFPNTDPVDPEDWLWLACGKGQHECGIGTDIQVQAKETHELRCCSPIPVSGWKRSRTDCTVWHESDLIGTELIGEADRLQCFHDVTYAQAQEICAANGGHVCTKEQVDSGCAKGSGCGHDGDLIWTGEPAPAHTLDSLPSQDPIDADDWLYLACGKGGAECGTTLDVTAQAKEEHEVRCCSDYPLPQWKRRSGCQNWALSNLTVLEGTHDTCFHSSTYEQAQEVCRANGGYVCSFEEVNSGCTRGSGCGHDLDFVWTSTGPAPARQLLPMGDAVADDAHLFLACGKGINGCGGGEDAVGVAVPNEKHEVRCCSPYALPGWKKNGKKCSNYHESDLTFDGAVDQCFHASTYADAQAICHENYAEVCTMSQVLDGCVRGSGCGHDGDLIWTKTAATDEAIAAFKLRKTQASAITGVCTGPKGRISGDPHFTTFDNYRYDCQGTGEFVIAMSKGSDPLAIHGRFVRTRATSAKPTITRSVAIKVVDEVPVIQVTAPPQKIDGKCPLTFTIGKDETPITEGIVAYVDANFNGALTAFSNGKNIIFTYDGVDALVQISAGGGGNRCVLNTNLCLTPESHGGAGNIVGLLGSPDGIKENDLMGRDGTIVPLPQVCDIPNPTNAEVKQCKSARNREGHEWCMENWCIGHADNSLWGEESHAQYNECDNRDPDGFFDNLDDVDPAIVEACEGTDDPDGCVLDTMVAIEEGENLSTFVQTIVDEDQDSNFVDNLGEGDPTEAMDGWDGPVLSNASAIEIELPLPDVPDIPDEPTDTGDEPQEVSESSGSLGDPHCKSFLNFCKLSG